ncbi:glycoside hydrolase family 2 TIM barrel-domain containing protein [Sunxiuqinia sp. sy24]|uniref:glycoside hydrolase family 2 TIM barrel-domain containing protein n=1 Tax=Sunxiuqinia sp. sy24 TaxID=3461495 RepID=UPI004045718F
MMKTRMFRACLPLMICMFFQSCGIESQTKPTDKINFNFDWQFIRLADSLKSIREPHSKTVQTGSDWQTQFNVEHMETAGMLNKNTVSDEMLKQELQTISSQSWDAVCLPHTAYMEPYTVVKPWQGICYYRKNFEIDSAGKDKKIFLEFEGAMQLADVWVNGKHMIQHAGGFTPFSIDLSKVVLFDQPNEILVRLDNRDNPLIPPGKPLGSLDFCYHSGIYRDVNLIIKNKTYITDAVAANQKAGGGVFISYPEVSSDQATIEVKVHVKNEAGKIAHCQLVHQLIDSKGIVQLTQKSEAVFLSEGTDQHITSLLAINNPELWSPDAPNLYALKTELFVDGKMEDSNKTSIGIRRIEITREKGLVLNGKPVRMVGTNRHMEYPYVGNAISDNAQYRDLYKIKQAGFNTVRLGHYPQDISVLDACDELGLLVIEPIPGWQFFNNDSVFTQQTYRDVRDIIRRDRNHPSIIVWETILNEAWPPAWWKDIAHKTAHEEYPGDQCFTAGDMYGYYGWDVLYNDWNENMTRPNDSDKPGFIREYGDYEFGGHFSTTRVSRKDGEDKLLQNAWNFQWSHNKYRQQYPWTIGDANWDMFDYNRGCCDNICHSGISELNRLPKFAYYFYRSQIDIGSPMFDGSMPPMIYIANWWTKRDTEKVIVYGNVDEVELFVNGKRIARQKPDAGSDSAYEIENSDRNNGGNPFDSGNGTSLKHAPFTFNKVSWSKGELKAVGYVNGQKVTEEKVSTPDEPASIRLVLDEAGRKLGTNDIVFVYAELLDENGALCVDSSAEIALQISGDAVVVSPVKIETEAGIAAFLIRTGLSQGEISIDASSTSNENLSGRLRIKN